MGPGCHLLFIQPPEPGTGALLRAAPLGGTAVSGRVWGLNAVPTSLQRFWPGLFAETRIVFPQEFGDYQTGSAGSSRKHTDLGALSAGQHRWTEPLKGAVIREQQRLICRGTGPVCVPLSEPEPLLRGVFKPELSKDGGASGLTPSTAPLSRAAPLCSARRGSSRSGETFTVNPGFSAGLDRVWFRVVGRVLVEGHGRVEPTRFGGPGRRERPSIEPHEREEEGAAVPGSPAQVPELRSRALLQEGHPDQTHLLPRLQRLHLGPGRLPV